MHHSKYSFYDSAPICTSPCQNNGVCTAPDTCTGCDTGYEGADCGSKFL